MLSNDECLVKTHDSHSKTSDLVWTHPIVGDTVEPDCRCNRPDDPSKSGDSDFGPATHKCYSDCSKGCSDHVSVTSDKGADKTDPSADESSSTDCEKVFRVKDIVESDDSRCKKAKDEASCSKTIGKDDKVT